MNLIVFADRSLGYFNHPTFTAPGSPAVLTFRLTVTDAYGLADSTPDEVIITVKAYTYLPIIWRR